MDTVILQCSLCNREWPFPAAAANIPEPRCNACVQAEWAKAMRLAVRLATALVPFANEEPIPGLSDYEAIMQARDALADAKERGIKYE